MGKQYESKRLLLRTITLDDKDALLDFRDEFATDTEKSYGDGGLSKADSFEEWYEKLRLYSKKSTVPHDRVPSTQFISISKESGRIIGMVNVRHSLIGMLLQRGGHIGDCIRKSERNKGYGTEQIKLALQFCKDKKIDRVLITCKKDNPASAKTIINNGGIKENEIISDGDIYERYWIQTK